MTKSKINYEKIFPQTAEEFYKEFYEGREVGVVSSFPVDETAIRAFGIRKKDLEGYYNDKRNGVEILYEILKNKEIVQDL